jgi:hypothetical protein
VIAFPEKLSGAGFEVTLGVRSNGNKHGSMKLMTPLSSAVETLSYIEGS